MEDENEKQEKSGADLELHVIRQVRRQLEKLPSAPSRERVFAYIQSVIREELNQQADPRLLALRQEAKQALPTGDRFLGADTERPPPGEDQGPLFG